MDEQQMEIDQLTKQFQILDEEQSKLPAGPQKAAIQRAAGVVKNKLVVLLNAQKAPKPEAAQPEPKQEPKTPDINSYFSGDFMNEAIQEYFSPELPEEMSRYFVRNEDAFSNAPSMPTPTATQQTGDDEEARKALRKRIMHAAGVF